MRRRALEIVRASGASAIVGSIGLWLPPKIDLLVGESYSQWFKGLLFLRSLTGVSVTISGPGAVEADRYVWANPTQGQHDLTINVSVAGELVARARTRLNVIPATGYSGTVALCFDGDSITADGGFINGAVDRLESAGLTVTAHNGGLAGWTAGDFSGHRTGIQGDSPYINGGAAYAAANGGPFTHCFWNLGANDNSGLGLPSPYTAGIALFREAIADCVQLSRDGSPTAWTFVGSTWTPSGDDADAGGAPAAALYVDRQKYLSLALRSLFSGRSSEKIKLRATHGASNPGPATPDDFDANFLHRNSLGHAREAVLTTASVLATL